VTETVVRAGGGIVWRRGEGGVVEIVLVHRPVYDDWSFPKGKLQPGETEAHAALREVQEETGCGAGWVVRSGPAPTVIRSDDPKPSAIGK
jgi:8-oxo-dGTP pyrophosphatase MutT (NUDIX family)